MCQGLLRWSSHSQLLCEYSDQSGFLFLWMGPKSQSFYSDGRSTSKKKNSHRLCWDWLLSLACLLGRSFQQQCLQSSFINYLIAVDCQLLLCCNKQDTNTTFTKAVMLLLVVFLWSSWSLNWTQPLRSQEQEVVTVIIAGFSVASMEPHSEKCFMCSNGRVLGLQAGGCFRRPFRLPLTTFPSFPHSGSNRVHCAPVTDILPGPRWLATKLPRKGSFWWT